jgi:hypothetical protein
MNHNAFVKTIRRYAEGVPEEAREDFEQDMWVMLAEIVQNGTYELSPLTSTSCPLNLILFRARANWLDKRSFEERSRQEYEETYVEPKGSVPSPEVAYEAEEALHGLAKYMSRKYLMRNFDRADIETIVEGLKNGESKASIAAALEMSPQNLDFYLIPFRKKAA